MHRYPAPDPHAPTFVFAHGAGAGEAHPWMKRVAQGLAARGIHVVTFEFPYMAAKRGRPDPNPVLESAYGDQWTAVAAEARGPLFAGGKSMGGRIASQAAARGLFDPSPRGLVFFGYPLHPPGQPAKRRDAHLPKVGAPMLFIQGTRDGFGSPDEMRELAAGLPASTLELIDDGDHSLVARKRAGGSADSIERAIELAARWMLSR